MPGLLPMRSVLLLLRVHTYVRECHVIALFACSLLTDKSVAISFQWRSDGFCWRWLAPGEGAVRICRAAGEGDASRWLGHISACAMGDRVPNLARGVRPCGEGVASQERGPRGLHVYIRNISTNTYIRAQVYVRTYARICMRSSELEYVRRSACVCICHVSTACVCTYVGVFQGDGKSGGSTL